MWAFKTNGHRILQECEQNWEKSADHKCSWLQLIPTFFSHFQTKVRIHLNEFPSKERGFDCQSQLNLFGMKNVNLRVPLIYTFRPKSVQLNSPYPSMANCKLFSHAFIIQTQPPKNRPAQYTALHSLYRLCTYKVVAVK